MTLLLEGPYTQDSEPVVNDLAIISHENALVPVEERLGRLRKDREVHTYKQIWTKDAHGGPYKKAGGKSYDPLLQLPDGTTREMELGYERVEGGPTTNFVGNHMTQGAIDLVQAELEKPASDALEQHQLPAGPPRLLECRQAVPSDSLQSPPAVPLQQYSWWDSGSAVCVQLDVVRCREQLHAAVGGPGAAVTMQLHCSFAERSVQLRLSCQGAQGEGRSGAGGGAPAAQPPMVQLVINPLCHAIQPALCSVAAVGQRALPAAQAAPAPAPSASPNAAAAQAEEGARPALPGSGSSSDGVSKMHELAPTATLAADPAPDAAMPAEARGPTSPAPPQPSSPTPSAAGSAPACLVLAPGVTAVLVRLHKANPALEWGSLQGSLAVAVPPTQRVQPDLAVLRKSLRQQRQAGRMPAAPAACGGGTPAQLAAQLCPEARPPTTTAASPHTSSEDLMQAARISVQMGQYQAAIHACTALLQQCAPQRAAAAAAGLASPAPGAGGNAVDAGGLADVLALRAACHCHMGGLKQAIADYSAALELCQEQPDVAAGEPGQPSARAASHPPTDSAPSATRLLLARSSAYEQLEQYGKALDDLQNLAARQQPAVDSQVAAGILRVSRSLKEAQRVQKMQQLEGEAGYSQPPSVPRQSQLFSRPKGLRI